MTGATETSSVTRRGRLVLMGLMVMAPLSAASAQGWPPWADNAFQDRGSWSREPDYRRQPDYRQETPERPDVRRRPAADAVQSGGARPDIVPRTPPMVSFTAPYPAKSIVIDTSTRKLYFVLDGNSAYEYRISVGREGFNWTGTETISRKQAWPDWYPPAEMRERDPKLPEKMTGGVRNPLGAIALYLGNTLYRIHGTNDVKSIGQAQSSGCFRMLNAEVLHLASIVEVGTPVSVVSSLSAAPQVGRRPAPVEPSVAQKSVATPAEPHVRDYQGLRDLMLRP